MTDIPDGGMWAGALAGLSTVGAWGYAAYRKKVRDGQSDNRVVAEETLGKRLQGIIESQEKRIDQLTESQDKRIGQLTDRLDKMAAERNVAVVENARLKTVVEYLNEKLKAQETKAAELEAEVSELRTIVDSRNMSREDADKAIEKAAMQTKKPVIVKKATECDLYPHQPGWKAVTDDGK